MRNVYKQGTIDCPTLYLKNTFNVYDNLQINYCALLFWIFIAIATLIVCVPIIISFINKKIKDKRNLQQIPSYNLEQLSKVLWENKETIQNNGSRDDWEQLCQIEIKTKAKPNAKHIDHFGRTLYDVLNKTSNVDTEL